MAVELITCVNDNGDERIFRVPYFSGDEVYYFGSGEYDIARAAAASINFDSSVTLFCMDESTAAHLLAQGFTDVINTSLPEWLDTRWYVNPETAGKGSGYFRIRTNGTFGFCYYYNGQLVTSWTLESGSSNRVVTCLTYTPWLGNYEPSVGVAYYYGQIKSVFYGGFTFPNVYELRALSPTAGALFWDGATPTPPTPEGDDPDPYDQIDGEGALPGDETVALPSEPTLTPIDAGLFSLYSPTVAQMKNLADFLWTDFGGSGATVEQVLGEVVEALKRSVSNPLNSMLGLSIIASQGLNKGSDSSVHVGFWNTGVSMTRLNKQYFTVDCGSVAIQPVCGGTFLDYAPYSKFSIFLPYVGMRILDANDVVGHTISVKYRGDAVSGALICFIQRDGQIIAEHAGNCALNLPLTADSWAETISGVAQMISGAVSGAAMGGTAAAAATGAVKGAASVATNPSALSPQVSHVGNVAGSAGHMGSQKPFILREAVRFHSTEGFNSIIGYPSYYYRRLGDCRGFTQCLDVHLNHTPATGDELKEIEKLLKQGVII